MKNIDGLAKVAVTMLLLVFGLVIFHAPLSVFFGQFYSQDIVKAWKEIILVLISPIVVFLVWRSKVMRQLSQNLLLRLIGMYGLLHLVLISFFDTTVNQKLAGLAIDLRYLLFFGLIFCLVALQPKLRKSFIKVSVIATSVSVAFAALQATVLPNDILKYIGYNKEAIEPYLTVDKNPDYIRINGTLRGPNPLGAYIVVWLSLAFALVLKKYQTLAKYKWWVGLFVLSGAISLWASYSRSALVALGVSLGLIFGIAFAGKIKLQHWLTVGVTVLIMMISLVALRDSSFVQNVVLHNNPNSGSLVDSNENHTESLQQGLQRFFVQPFGSGIGSTGSASLKSDEPLIVENQYLFIAHETGWLGLGLFVAIYVMILGQLYKYKRDWLSLGVFASGVGLACIGMLLPVWADDTVSLVWFGLAGVALASQTKLEKTNHAKTN